MPRPDPAARTLFRSPPVFLPGVLTVVLLAFLPNPLTDRLFSAASKPFIGHALEFQRVRCLLPGGIAFRSLTVSEPKKGVLLRAQDGRARFFLPDGRSRFEFGAVDLGPLAGTLVSAARFLRQHELTDLLTLRSSVWSVTRRRGRICVRLLDAVWGQGKARGGLVLEDGGLVRFHLALWVPESLWGRFPEIAASKFRRDGSRLRVTLTWAEGRWRLWGRQGPVLEARWQ